MAKPLWTRSEGDPLLYGEESLVRQAAYIFIIEAKTRTRADGFQRLSRIPVGVNRPAISTTAVEGAR